ncbi:MAG: helix-turn-helix domain-containing protein [Patescibacteria group bacterium]
MKDKVQEKYYVRDIKKVANVLSNKNIPSGAKLLLEYLIKKLGGKDHCWPSQELISTDLGLSVRQIRRLVRILEKEKLLKVKRGGVVHVANKKNGTERKIGVRSNIYYLEGLIRDNNIYKKSK